MLRYDEARCNGVGFPSEDEPGQTDWREGCEDCARRLSPVPDGRDVPILQPPAIIAFWCPWYIPMEES